jgi:hypothetical protein
MLSKKLGIYIPLPYTFSVKKHSPFNEGLTWNSLWPKPLKKLCIIDYMYWCCVKTE